MKKILVVSPHPDDETLGCGGTILKHISKGDEVTWVIMTSIKGTEFEEVRIKQRAEEIEKVSEAYGFKRLFKLEWPAASLDTVPKSNLVLTVSEILQAVKPEVLYVPNKNDVHSDHGVTFDVFWSAVKSFRSPFVKKVLMYEVISETEFAPPFPHQGFIPNSFSDIADFIEKKNCIMEIFKSEMGEHPFPRSTENIKALATFRGATAGVNFAESFMLLKTVW